MRAVDLHRVAVDCADIGTQILQNFQAHGNVRNLGDIFNATDPVHQKGSGDNGNSSILCAADFNFSKQGLSTLYNIFCQNIDPLFKQLTAKPFFGKDSLPARRHFIPALCRRTVMTYKISISYLCLKCKRFLREIAAEVNGFAADLNWNGGKCQFSAVTAPVIQLT